MKQREHFYNSVKLGVDIKATTPFEINYLLAYTFKEESKNLTKERKVEELKKLSLKIINNIAQSYEKRRKRKHPTKKRCFVCNLNRASCHHHIIMISNGGYDHEINRIPICRGCHEKIHPWLIGSEWVKRKKPVTKKQKKIEKIKRLSKWYLENSNTPPLIYNI